MVANGLGNVGFQVAPNGAVQFTHKPIGDTNSTIGFWTESATSTLKTATAAHAWMLVAPEVGLNVPGVESGFVYEGLTAVKHAASMTAAPGAMKSALQFGGDVVNLTTDPSFANLTKAAVDANKMAAKSCEAASGYFGAIGGEYSDLSKSLGTAKHGLHIPLDLRDIHNTYASRQQLNDPNVPDALPTRPDFKEAQYSANTVEGIKGLSALAYHTLCFATGFFALTVSPFWGLFVGGAYLVASVVSVVFDIRVDDIRQGDAYARLKSLEGYALQPVQVQV